MKTVSSSRSSSNPSIPSIPSNPSNPSSSRSSRSSSNPSSSSTSSSAKFKQDLFEKGVIYHNGKRKITELQIVKWETKLNEIHTIILDNFQFTDDKLYIIFLDFLSNCKNLKHLIIKRKDVKKDVKKEVDYFQDTFFIYIRELKTLELLELNSFHIKRLEKDNAKGEFFEYFVILLSKLEYLKNLILKNNYMYTQGTNHFAGSMFNKDIEIDFKDSKSITYRYVLKEYKDKENILKKIYRYYIIYIDIFKKGNKTEWETLVNRLFYLHAVDNIVIEDGRPEKNLPDFKTRESNDKQILLLKEYGITDYGITI
jgi:hypothetical protein